MNDWGCKIRMFLATLLTSALGGVIPAVGCTGGCGACFQCAGLGSVITVLAAVGMARKIGRARNGSSGGKAPCVE